MVLVPVVCCILGIAEHFVITFKGEAILPSDILALGTAMEVSEGYEFTFTAGIVTFPWGFFRSSDRESSVRPPMSSPLSPLTSVLFC